MEFFNKNFNNLGNNNDGNWKRSSIFDTSYYDGESVLDQSFRFQRNKMMKFIKGGTKANGGFFSKIMGNNGNRQDTMKFINDFKGQALNNNNFKFEQIENQLNLLDKDILNTTQSEFY